MHLRIGVSDGSVVVVRRTDESHSWRQIRQAVAVDVTAVDVDVDAAIWTQVFRQHAQHVRQQSDQVAELKQRTLAVKLNKR